MNNKERACSILDEIVKSDCTLIATIKSKSEMFREFLLNNSESLEIDEEIYLTFQHEKLDQFCRIVKEYREKLDIYRVSESLFEEYFEHCVGNLTKFLENDQYLETFIVNTGTIECNIWKAIFKKVTGNSAIINLFVISRLSRYTILYKELRKLLDESEKIEKCDALLKKLENSTVQEQGNFLIRVKKNSEFLKAIELYNFDFILANLEFEILDSKMGNHLIKKGSVAISKMGELLLFKQNSNEIERDLLTIQYMNILNGLYASVPSMNGGNEYEIELDKVVNINNMMENRIIYGDGEIQIISKENLQIILRFKQKEDQLNIWNALSLKRKVISTYFEVIKANEKQHDIQINFQQF